MSKEIFQTLIRQYPRARLSTADQPLPEADFEAQKHKHFSRRALGGAIGIIHNARGQIVLAKRSGMHAGWSLPGGTVEEGEDFSAAFRREIMEEIGVSLDLVDLIEVERKGLSHHKAKPSIFCSPSSQHGCVRKSCRDQWMTLSRRDLKSPSSIPPLFLPR